MINISLTDIPFLRNDSNEICHIRRKTLDEQYSLAEQANHFKFSKEFEFKKQMQDMVYSLETIKLFIDALFDVCVFFLVTS